MVERICEEIRSRLALGEAGTSDMDHHLAACEACRFEAGRLRRVVARLADAPEVEVPAALDRVVRERLLEPVAVATRPFSRPSLAASLAVGGLLALTAALAGALAQTGAAEQGAYLALLIALGYTTVSAAVTFPLLLMRDTRLAREREV